MRMDLIQPFIGSLDTVLAEMMQAPAKIADVEMEEEGYRKKGLAAVVTFKGQIEGRIVLEWPPTSPEPKWTPRSPLCRRPSASLRIW
jgi:CheY-specific phosphatase CheX